MPRVRLGPCPLRDPAQPPPERESAARKPPGKRGLPRRVTVSRRSWCVCSRGPRIHATDRSRRRPESGSRVAAPGKKVVEKASEILHSLFLHRVQIDHRDPANVAPDGPSTAWREVSSLTTLSPISLSPRVSSVMRSAQSADNNGRRSSKGLPLASFASIRSSACVREMIRSCSTCLCSAQGAVRLQSTMFWLGIIHRPPEAGAPRPAISGPARQDRVRIAGPLPLPCPIRSMAICPATSAFRASFG